MSILQKILNDMYIEPDLLVELDDDQKQVLFCKLREEQVRRYMEFEKNLEVQNMCSDHSTKTKSAKTVQWLTGADGQPWVWVMGEHPDDKTIEQILDEEAQEKARKLAEQEAEMLRLKEEAELKEKLRQELLEIERERELKKVLAESGNEDVLSDGAEVVARASALGNINNSVNVRPDGLVIMRCKAYLSKGGNAETLTELERRLREETDRKIDQEKNRRTSEIYQTLVEAREKKQAEAADAAEEERRYWEIQERKFQHAENQIRLLAKKARQQHKLNTLQSSSSFYNELNNNAAHRDNKTDVLNNMNVKNRKDVKISCLEKADSRQMVVRWFLESEAPRGAGLLPGTSRMASWFHGIVGRGQAEILLASRSPGSFLVRLNGCKKEVKCTSCIFVD